MVQAANANFRWPDMELIMINQQELMNEMNDIQLM